MESRSRSRRGDGVEVIRTEAKGIGKPYIPYQRGIRFAWKIKNLCETIFTIVDFVTL